MNGGAIINPLQGLSEFTILFGDEKVRNKVYNYLVLEARVLADVVVGGLAVHVVPEVVPGPGEEEVMVLVHGEAVLVIWLSNFNHDMGDMWDSCGRTGQTASLVFTVIMSGRPGISGKELLSCTRARTACNYLLSTQIVSEFCRYDFKL